MTSMPSTFRWWHRVLARAVACVLLAALGAGAAPSAAEDTPGGGAGPRRATSTGRSRAARPRRDRAQAQGEEAARRGGRGDRDGPGAQDDQGNPEANPGTKGQSAEGGQG